MPVPLYGTTSSPPTVDSETHTGRHRRKTNATFHSHQLHYNSSSPTAHLEEYSEQDPFLPTSSPSHLPSTSSAWSTQRQKLATLWILPVVVIANLSRGMTMAPRIEVYTQISCDALHPGEEPGPPTITTRLPLTLGDFQSYYQGAPLPHDVVSTALHGRNAVQVMTPPAKCLHDPAVQSRAANIQATLGTIVGVLSIITASYWGQVSDAFGRKKTLTANLFGMMFHDAIYILVSIPNSIFNRNAWRFLIMGPIVEGLLGGLTTLHAAQNAYLTDCAPPGSRSTIFAYYQGSIYVSLALGPQLAGIFLHGMSSEAGLPVFYLGFTFNIVCLLYAIVILPETVTHEMMHAARQSGASESTSLTGSEAMGQYDRMRYFRHRLLSPLMMFGPHRRPGGGWDLNLTFLVIAQFTHLMSVGVVQVKYLYAQHTYAWSVKQLGYYISLLWMLRAFHLLLLLPTIIHFVKPCPPPSFSVLQLLSQNLRFDYRIAQLSIFIDTTAYILTLIAPTASQVLFITFTSLSSFTAGVNPAIHSLAVSFLQVRENESNIGQMFGGMSMLQAIAHTVQPLLFGLVYSKTVAVYPKAIFALAAGLLLASVVLLTLLHTKQMLHAGPENAVVEEDISVWEDDCFGVGNEEGAEDSHTRREDGR